MLTMEMDMPLLENEFLMVYEHTRMQYLIILYAGIPNYFSFFCVHNSFPWWLV